MQRTMSRPSRGRIVLKSFKMSSGGGNNATGNEWRFIWLLTRGKPACCVIFSYYADYFVQKWSQTHGFLTQKSCLSPFWVILAIRCSVVVYCVTVMRTRRNESEREDYHVFTEWRNTEQVSSNRRLHNWRRG